MLSIYLSESSENFTKGKLYDLQKYLSSYYFGVVVSDKNELVTVAKHHFISLDDYRNQVLDDLLYEYFIVYFDSPELIPEYYGFKCDQLEVLFRFFNDKGILD